MPLLTDSFCRKQSMVIRVKPLKKEFNWNDIGMIVHFFHERFDSKTYGNINTYINNGSMFVKV